MRPATSTARRAPTKSARLAALVLATSAWGVPVPTDAATNVIRTGTIDVSGTVTIVTPTPTSDTISASVEVTAYDSTSLDSQVVYVDTTVKRSGNTATVTVAIPYKFIFDAARVGSATLTTTLTLYVDNTQAYASSGPLSIPASGAKTPVTVHLAL